MVGSLEHSDRVARLLGERGVKLPSLPNSDKTHPESFVVKTMMIREKPHVLVAGIDERAIIYGVGHLLRVLEYRPDSIDIPSIDAAEKPAFQIRGGRPSGPGRRAREYGRLREQTDEERMEVMEDIMLLGANVFGGNPQIANSYGMLTTFRRTANVMPGDFPPEWGADRDMSRGYICPSIPEARKALLESFDKLFRETPYYDFLTTNSGDNGGCRCERCMPWGGTYIKLVQEIADILHKHHPKCKILATNQDLTDEGNREIFDYLNSQDSSWLYALYYGPGADEMQTYIRGPVNSRWFEYEGFGPLGNFLKHMHHELPRETNLVLFSDITHWIQSQYGITKPDVVLAAVYGRRSWNARPKYLHRVAMETFHYAIGDIHYSEGMHDDFNKWLWYRLLWNPHRSPEEITLEYCRYWFGPEAADDVSSAIFLMEETLDRPIIDNSGISQAVNLLCNAGDKIPRNVKKTDYRWHIITQKALMNHYIQLKLRRGMMLKEQTLAVLDHISTSNNPGKLVSKAIEILELPQVTEEMISIRDKVMALGRRSNKIIGYRSPAPFIVDKLDITEIGWWRKILGEALTSRDDSRMKNAVKMLTDYENPGEGGYYDNLGWPNETPRLISGETLWGLFPFFGPAKLSQYNMAYCWEKDHEVTLSYSEIDPAAEYMVRICLGFHRAKTIGRIPQMMISMMHPGKVKHCLRVNEQVIEELNVPEDGPKYYDFDLPRDTTETGKVEISLSPKSSLPVVGPSEIWIMKKDHIIWHQ